MSDLKTIRQLIKMMVDNDLTEIDLEGEGEKIKLKRGGAGGVGGPNNVQYVTAPPAAPEAGSAPAAVPAAAGAGESADSDSDDGTITIDSPMVGTFYTSSSPDADAFVSAGDAVKADTVVCIVEAMKVFNEIKADVTGKVVEVLVETGQAVEFGQPLFKIKP